MNRLLRPTGPLMILLLTTNFVSCTNNIEKQNSNIKISAKEHTVNFLPEDQHYKVVKINLVWKGKNGTVNDICSGSLIAPNIVATAAHCTHNYSMNGLLPTTETTILTGPGFRERYALYSDKQGEGWFEFGAADFGLYRLKEPVKLPEGYKLFDLTEPCAPDDKVTIPEQVVVMGRMLGNNEAPMDQFSISSPITVRSASKWLHARGIYIRITESVNDPGDSGGPWVDGNTLVAVTSTGAFGSKLCNIIPEIRKVLDQWKN